MNEVEWNVSEVLLPGHAEVTGAMDAKALAMLARYLQRAPERTDNEDTIARDAYVCGFRDGHRIGGNEAIDACTSLAAAMNDDKFRISLARLVNFLDQHATAGRRDDWKEVRKA